MNYHIQVFAGLAEQMGGPIIMVPTEQETMTVAALKDLLSECFPESAAQLQVLLLPEIKSTPLLRTS